MVREHHQFNGHNLSKLWEIAEDRGAWYITVHGITKNQTQLSD